MEQWANLFSIQNRAFRLGPQRFVSESSLLCVSAFQITALRGVLLHVACRCCARLCVYGNLQRHYHGGSGVVLKCLLPEGVTITTLYWSSP